MGWDFEICLALSCKQPFEKACGVVPREEVHTLSRDWSTLNRKSFVHVGVLVNHLLSSPGWTVFFFGGGRFQQIRREHLCSHDGLNFRLCNQMWECSSQSASYKLLMVSLIERKSVTEDNAIKVSCFRSRSDQRRTGHELGSGVTQQPITPVLVTKKNRQRQLNLARHHLHQTRCVGVCDRKLRGWGTEYGPGGLPTGQCFADLSREVTFQEDRSILPTRGSPTKGGYEEFTDQDWRKSATRGGGVYFSQFWQALILPTR